MGLLCRKFNLGLNYSLDYMRGYGCERLRPRAERLKFDQ
jgi:hypothetical protein